MTGRNIFNVLQQKSKARINGPMAEEKDRCVMGGRILDRNFQAREHGSKKEGILYWTQPKKEQRLS